MAERTTEAVRLASSVRHAMSGTPWHGSSLATLLDGVTAEDAMRRPIAGAHSIWDLVLHLTAWCDEVTRRLRTHAVQMPEAGDWPAPPADASPAAWRAACDAMHAAHDTLAQALAAATDDALAQRVGEARDAPLGAGLSVRATVLGVVQHAAYHGGQIALLRKALSSIPS